MKYLLIITIAISLLILTLYCYRSYDKFSNDIPEFSSIHVLQGTGDSLKNSQNVRDSIFTIPNTSFREHSKRRKEVENFKDYQKPSLSNPVSRKHINCSNYVFSCENLGEEPANGCALCYDDVNNTPKNGFLKADKNLGKFNDCPCNFDNKQDCINYRLIRECKNIKNPFDLAVSMFDCGFVFTDPNGIVRNTDRGIHVDNNETPVKVNTLCANANNATNPNHVIMPKISKLISDKNISTNIANKRVAIAKWINEKFNGKSNYVDACQDELNDNGKLITHACMKQIYRGVGGEDKGRENPTSVNFENKRQKYRSVKSYQNHMQELQTRAKKTKNNLGPYTVKQVVEAKLALYGYVDCTLADDLELTGENSDFLAQCYKNEYDNTYCLKDNSHYPSDPSKTLKYYAANKSSGVLPVYKGKTFGDYKKFIRNVEDTLAQARENPSLYYEDDTKNKFGYCFGREYNVDNLTGGKYGHMQQMFDVAITHLYSNQLINFVSLPFINMNEKTMKYQLRNAYDNTGTYTGNDTIRVKVHAQGALHFTTPGTYYFRATYDDLAYLNIDNGITIKQYFTSGDDTYRTRGIRYKYGKITITSKHSIYPFNLILHQATGPGGIKFEYIRSDNNNLNMKNINHWKVVNNEEPTGSLPELRAIRIERLTNVKSVSFYNNKNLTHIPVIQLDDSTISSRSDYNSIGYRGNLKEVEITPIVKGNWTLISNTNRNKGVYNVLDGNPDKEINHNTSSGNYHMYRGKEYIKDVANNLFSGSKLFKEQEYPTFNIRNVKQIKFHLKQPLSVDSVQVWHPYSGEHEDYKKNSEYYALHSNRNSLFGSGAEITFILPLYRYYKIDTRTSRLGHNSSLVSRGIYQFGLYPTARSFNNTENRYSSDELINKTNIAPNRGVGNNIN